MLRAELGGRCAHCGTTENLEFDHIDPDAPRHCPDTSTVGFVRSITLYWRDHLDFCNIQLLCKRCNREKWHRKTEQLELEGEPF